MGLQNYPRPVFGPSELGLRFGLAQRGLDIALGAPLFWTWRVGLRAHFSNPINNDLKKKNQTYQMFECSTQGLKFPIYRRYIGYRALSKRFLIHKIVCRKNREKSENVGDISAKYRILTEISVEISALGRHARVGIFLVFSGRYIADI